MSDSQKIPLRSEIASNDQWDLTPLFESDQAWETHFSETGGKLDGYQTFKGRLLESPEQLANGLDFHMEISRAIENLYTYAHLKNDEDKTNSGYTGMMDRAMGLFTSVSECGSFIDPEIQSMDEATQREFLSSPRLKKYRFFLEKILRAKPHTHDEAIERILAMSLDVAREYRECTCRSALNVIGL